MALSRPVPTRTGMRTKGEAMWYEGVDDGHVSTCIDSVRRECLRDAQKTASVKNTALRLYNASSQTHDQR